MLPNYPPSFLRGIPNRNPQFFDNQGNVTGGVFRPHDQQLPENGFYKISINWEDNAGVENFTLNERLDDGSYHYNGGAARVSLERLELMRQDPPWVGSVEYNREPIAEINEYHGNLLLNEDRIVNRISKKALLARLRLTVIAVVPPLI